MNPTSTLLNPRQKSFADRVIVGTPAGRAWEQAGYHARGNAAEVEACKALKKPKIKAYIKAERARLEKAGEFERSNLVEYLVNVIRTPVGQLDGGSPLVQEFITEQGEAGTRTKVKMANKLQATKQLADVMGWSRPQEVKVDLSEQLSELIFKVRNKH
jgi:phage terminase small subunit